MDFYPENPEGGEKNFENREITYCEAYHNTGLSVDVIPIGRVTSDLSVFDDLDSRVDITFSLAQ